MRLLCLLLLLPFPVVFSFIVGGCIGPKSVLERFLNDKQKSELRKMVHTKFDGSNSEQVRDSEDSEEIHSLNAYLQIPIKVSNWHS